MRHFITAFFIVVASFFFVLAAQAPQASAQSLDDVKNDVLSALATPLPITVIGPLISNDVNVVAEGDSFRATINNAALMGFIPVGTVSFKMKPEDGEGTYRITEFKLPQTLDILGAADLRIGSVNFDGLWSSQTRSYRSLQFQLLDVGVNIKNGPGGQIDIGTLALEVAKEGVNGADESRFAIVASNLASKGLPPNDVRIASLVAQLQADGEEPVDLYAVLSRFVVLSVMQGDQSALLSFAESLRAKNYDSVFLTLGLNGFEMQGSSTGSNERISIERITGSAGIAQMTPKEWGSLVINFDGANLIDNGFLEAKEMEVEAASLALAGNRIPIGDTLSAIGKLQLLLDNKPVKLKATELLDGFLNFGALTLTGKGKGISFLPQTKNNPIVKVAAFETNTSLNGFKDQQGRISVATTITGMDIAPRQFSSALDQRVFQTLNPKVIRYDLTFSDLNEALLRKLLTDIELSSEEEALGLAVPGAVYAMALKPLVESKNIQFQSTEIDVSMSSKVRFFPMWLLQALPYEGSAVMKITGIDKLDALFQDLQNAPSDQVSSKRSDRQALVVMRSVLSTFKALAQGSGESLSWNIQYPKAGEALILINDTELRFPDFSGLLPLAGMGAYMGR